jgi:threonine/homoserine/homoserine lactone efflux protein
VGLSALLAASPTAFTVLKVAGAAYLLWLAVSAIRHGSAFRLDGTRETAEPLWRIFRNGLTINLLNPKIIVFFVTFLPQFIDAGDQHAGGKLFFLGMLFIVVATPITAPMILSAARLAVFLRSSPRALRAFDWGFAGVMGAFAVKLAMTQSR